MIDDAFFDFKLHIDGKTFHVFGPRSARNWVFLKLSQFIEAEQHAPHEVERHINNNWESCNDWKKLAH